MGARSVRRCAPDCRSHATQLILDTLELMIELPPLAIGAIVAALITGLISLLGLIISKEQKVSEFRQDWIDALRSELAALISHANAIHGAKTATLMAKTTAFPGDAGDTWARVRLDFVGINEAVAKIRLRLNPKEKESIDVLNQIDALEQALAPNKSIHYSNLNKLEKELVAKAQVVLKKEWRRVQKGERVYQIAKYFAIAILSAGIVALIVATIAIVRANEF